MTFRKIIAAGSCAVSRGITFADGCASGGITFAGTYLAGDSVSGGITFADTCNAKRFKPLLSSVGRRLFPADTGIARSSRLSSDSLGNSIKSRVSIMQVDTYRCP